MQGRVKAPARPSPTFQVAFRPILSARGYDLLEDAKEFGREVIPLVRAEVAKRDAAGHAA